MMIAAATAVETVALTKRFGTHPALDGVDLRVEEGVIFGVIGPNGAGKTTLMRLMLDILRPSSGSVRVLGEEPRAGGPALRRQIGFLPGELRLEGRITGRELLRHYAEVSGPVERGAADALADRLGLDLGRQVRTLSKGNKQKLGIVQAFMHRPRLLVLDEPTSGLDPLVQQEFLAMMREARQGGQTVFLSSHVLSEIQAAADRVAILRAGRVVVVSDVDSLRETAVRRVRVDVRPGAEGELRAALTALPNVTGLAFGAEDHRIRASATVEGAIDPFVKVIARFPVEELTVEEPDLEESVLRLYGERTGGGERTGDGERDGRPARRRAGAHRGRSRGRDHDEPREHQEPRERVDRGAR